MSDDATTHHLEGDCFLSAADDLHARLSGLMASGGPLTLDLSGVGAVDVSFVQLMVSASLTAERAGQSLTLTGFPPALRVAFERAGVVVDPAAGRIALT